MTDDAVPADNRLIEQLMAAFDQRGPGGVGDYGLRPSAGG